MFTGIIEEVGNVQSITERAGTKRLTVSAPNLAKELKIGNSIAVSGVCLTAVDIGPAWFVADLAAETVRRTSFSRIHEGAQVNLELPARYGDRMGGHIVQGHVDGVGKFLSLDRVPGAEDYWLKVEVPPDIARYTVFKGSISIEGISLTVAKVEGNLVEVAIIPHTREMTNLHSLKPGDPVNLEADVLAKYAEKLVQGKASKDEEITIEKLVAQGY